MTTLTKFIVGLITSLMLFSCHFDIQGGSFGVRGNGEVETIERNVSEDFDAIHVSRGLDVYLTQSSEEGIIVEADENLHDIIITEVKGNTLHIYADENISYSKSRKVKVSFDTIDKITATSGSDVYSTNTISANRLELSTTSGSDMELDVDAETIDCSSTSGSDLRLSGTTDKLYATATSGSDIKASDLIAKICDAKATSGADITIHTSEELLAKATSGGDIKYYGNPEKVSKKDGVSGSIRKQ